MLFNTCCVILAAGEGKRMNSGLPKVLLSVLFKPMIMWALEAVQKSNIEDICVVKGFKRELVQEYVDRTKVKCESVIQDERRGTAHAVMMARDFLIRHKGGDVFILGGDSPFIDKDTILNSYELHKSRDNSLTIISAKVDNPFGYGRIVRDDINNSVIEIVEEKDAKEKQRNINEINSGAYWFKVDDLISHLFTVSDDTFQNEYYLTSIIKPFLNANLRIDAFEASSPDVVLGANDMAQLEKLNLMARKKVIDKLVSEGVDIPNREGVMISNDAVIHPSATILKNTVILGKTIIEEGAVIGPSSQIVDSKIGKKAVVASGYCEKSVVQDGRIVEPFTIINNNEESKMSI